MVASFPPLAAHCHWAVCASRWMIASRDDDWSTHRRRFCWSSQGIVMIGEIGGTAEEQACVNVTLCVCMCPEVGGVARQQRAPALEFARVQYVHVFAQEDVQ